MNKWELLNKLGMVDENDKEPNWNDLPSITNFVNDLALNNDKEILKQLLVCLLYETFTFSPIVDDRCKNCSNHERIARGEMRAEEACWCCPHSEVKD